jgi:uncharacterized repeat protein (TIGR03803 family)
MLTTFDRFNYYVGGDPVGGLVQAGDGYVYGAAYDGGGYPGHGTVFRLALGSDCSDHAWNPCGNLSLVFRLGIEYPGLYPYAGLVQGRDGNLYGTTAYGGAHGAGNVFRIIMAGNECTLTYPTNMTVSNDPGQCAAVVDFGPPVTTNCAGYVITANPPSGSFFPVGTNTVTWTAVDSASGQLTNTCSFLVTVRDCEPPVIRSISAIPASLWPPNHKMQPVTLRVSAIDNCHLARCKIVSVTSNEPDDKRDEKDEKNRKEPPDWEITGDLSLNLRAEQSGHPHDRVYTITAECTDDSGNKSTAVVHVTVRH